VVNAAGIELGENGRVIPRSKGKPREAQVIKDWKTYRSRLMALEKDWTRRPWAFWVYEQGMDDAPIGGEQGQIILDRKLYRSEAEKRYLELWEGGEWMKAIEWERAHATAAS
jgi:hypothetical protein